MKGRLGFPKGKGKGSYLLVYELEVGGVRALFCDVGSGLESLGTFVVGRGAEETGLLKLGLC